MTDLPAADDPIAFIHANTVVESPPLTPELRLYLAHEITPIWEATEEALRQRNVAPPFWAFAWPGGQVLARHLLDNPETVVGRRVLDFAAGGGIGAIAAAWAGAAHVVANDVDALALAAVQLNAEINGVAVETIGDDLIGRPGEAFDVILAGDICYEQPLADRVARWLRDLAAAGKLVLMGDPGRAYLPREGLQEVACHTVPTSLELEDRELRETRIYRVLGD